MGRIEKAPRLIMPFIIARYLLRKFAPLFFLSLMVLVGILMMSHFLRLFSLAVMKGISIFWIIGCFARLLPFIMALALPMAFLVSILLSFGEFAQGSEIMAMRSCGLSFWDIIWPFFAVTVLLSGTLFYLNHKASPEGYHAFRKQYLRASSHINHIDLEPGSFLILGNWKLYAARADKKTGRMRNVYLVDISKTRDLRIVAPNGQLTVQKSLGAKLVLKDGSIFFPNSDPTKLTVGHFGTYQVDIPLAEEAGASSMDIPEMNSRTLIERIHNPKTTPEHQREYRVELAVRSAEALSPLIFFLISVPIGVGLGRDSRARGFALSLGILFTFYGLLSLGIGVGRRNPNLSGIAPWAADAAGLATGIFLYVRALTL